MKAFTKIILILVFFSTFYSCGKKEVETTEEAHHEEEGIVELTQEQFKNANIKLGKIEMKNINSTISVNGVLDVPPQQMVSVSAMMGGFIKTTDLLQGLVVKKGEIIATIQNPDFIQIQSDYLESKEKLIYAEQEFKRQEELSKENVAASKIFQQVSAEYKSLQVTLGAIEERLKILNINPNKLSRNTIKSVVNIYAPIGGHVTTVNVNIGKFVNPQDVICEIVDTDHLHAELTVFEKDIQNVKIGQKVRFILVNENDKERVAKVYLINKQISEDRTIRVHAHLEKEDATLIPNMYLKGIIELENGSASPALPENAVVNVGEKFFIFIKSDDHHSAILKSDVVKSTSPHPSKYIYEAIEIQKGITQNGYTEILLPEGFVVEEAQVVVNGAYDLLTKMNNGEEEGHAH